MVYSYIARGCYRDNGFVSVLVCGLFNRGRGTVPSKTRILQSINFEIKIIELFHLEPYVC